MLAVLYILLISVFGCCFIKTLLPDIRRFYVASAVTKKVLSFIPDWLFVIPAGTIVGILIANFANYLILYGVAKAIPDHEACKRASVILTVALFLYFTIHMSAKLYRRSKASVTDANSKGASSNSGNLSAKIPSFDNRNINILFYGFSIVFFTVVASFLYFYTYRVSNGQLLMGYSVYSDLSPHTSMVSSFGVGFNMPTHYMHFSDDGIRYHFLFYYFCGMLQYLGLSIDFALNVASIISMVCCFMLLGLLGIFISGRRLPFILAPILVLFRSSFNVFSQIIKLRRYGGHSVIECIKLLSKSSGWSDITPYDSWGIWAINVYANQRHLIFGVALIVLLILIFLPYVRRMSVATMRCDGFLMGLKYFFFSRNSWIWRTGDNLNPWGATILSMIIAITMPYYHGSCLIAVLLILFGMAIISESRLIYLCCALSSVISSFIQTRLFSGSASNVVNFKFNPGFILGKTTAPALVSYLLMITGLTIVLTIVIILIYLVSDILRGKPFYRFFLGLCFSLPFIFGFTFQITTEMLANHKFLQISLILFDVFVAAFLSNLFIIPFKIRPNSSEEVSSSKSSTSPSPASPNETSNVLASETSNALASETETTETAAITETVVAAEDLETVGTFEAVETAEISETSNLETYEDITSKVEEPKADNSENSPQTLPTPPETPKSSTSGIPLWSFILLQVGSIILAIALLIPLLSTGISEWCVYYNLNRWYLTVNTRSELVSWINRNTNDSDVFLTPEWSINRFNLTGRAMYYGWPYYAWSAGHDTFKRDEIYHWLLTGCNGDIDEFVRYCKERNIRYIIADPEFDQSGETAGYFNWQFFAENLTQVAYFVDDNNTIIYKIY